VNNAVLCLRSRAIKINTDKNKYPDQ